VKKSVKPAKKAKRKISAAGIARIRAAQKAHWAKVKWGYWKGRIDEHDTKNE
jgi:hypothetical protein